jgi:hypothetical protein
MVSSREPAVGIEPTTAPYHKVVDEGGNDVNACGSACLRAFCPHPTRLPRPQSRNGSAIRPLALGGGNTGMCS